MFFCAYGNNVGKESSPDASQMQGMEHEQQTGEMGEPAGAEQAGEMRQPAGAEQTDKIEQTTEGSKKEMTFMQISQDEAKELMAKEEGYIILDVRTQSEYANGHIPGAICVPNEGISNVMPAELPDLDQLILVYCRSGNRSKQAAKKLAEIGYTNIREFGGINTWDGEIE